MPSTICLHLCQKLLEFDNSWYFLVLFNPRDSQRHLII